MCHKHNLWDATLDRHHPLFQYLLVDQQAEYNVFFFTGSVLLFFQKLVKSVFTTNKLGSQVSGVVKHDRIVWDVKISVKLLETAKICKYNLG